MHPEQLQQAPSANDYTNQLNTKLARLTELLGEHVTMDFDVYRSSPSGYRMRAEFRVWHDEDELNYVMFAKGEPKLPIIIRQYLPGSSLMQELMPKLISSLRDNTELRQKLFQIDFLTTTTGQCLISLLYHRKLGDDWLNQARILEQDLEVSVIGRSRKQKVVCSKDNVIESIKVGANTLRYQQYENSFTQPNAAINQHMLGWAHQQTLDSHGDLLELYCGNGNFSLALAPNFNNVLATEMDKFGIRAAQFNIEENGIDNVKVVRMSAAEVASALSGEREYRRMANICLESFRFNTVLVDPPRAGLDSNALEFVRTFKRVIYISCNPTSLLENLQQLKQTHRVTAAALFDQFPFTEHIECGLVLEQL